MSRAPDVLTESECWDHLRATDVGRLAVVVDGRPEIFPVNYVVDRGTVVFQTAEGTKLSGAVGRDVALEIDGWDERAGTAWSVLVKARGRDIRNLFDVLDAMDLPLETWHAGPKPHLVRLEPAAVTGRRFVRSAPLHLVRPRRAAPE